MHKAVKKEQDTKPCLLMLIHFPVLCWLGFVAINLA